MESPSPQTKGADSASGQQQQETPNQRQARLRRERREAKLKDEGLSRLEKITKVSGRQQLPDDMFPDPPISVPPEQQQQQQQPLTTSFAGQGGKNNKDAPPTEDDIRAFFRAGMADQQQQQQGENGGDAGAEQDPMMQMLSMLMGGGAGGNAPGGAGGGEGGPQDPTAGLPPGLAAMLGGGMPFPGQASQQQQAEGKTYAYVWKIIHALFALALGIYATRTSTAFFSGNTSLVVDSSTSTTTTTNSVTGRASTPKLRPQAPTAAASEGGMNLFLAFATAELILQSSRFLFERSAKVGMLGGAAAGAAGFGTGWTGMLINLLPEPYRGYLILIGRYMKIWSVIVEDAMVIVFVVGCVAWYKGAVG